MHLSHSSHGTQPAQSQSLGAANTVTYAATLKINANTRIAAPGKKYFLKLINTSLQKIFIFHYLQLPSKQKHAVILPV
jgi:hypothetical protein